jgi:hypothetical protein
MRVSLSFRIAAVVNLLFALGHTAGFLSFSPKSPDGQAAIRAMAVVFSEGGTRYSYEGFYKGFGLSCALAMVLIAVLSWWLGGLAKATPRATIAPGIALIAYQIGGLVLALLFFPLFFIVFSFVNKGASIESRLIASLGYSALFVPLTYMMDRTAYRSYLRRSGRDPQPKKR